MKSLHISELIGASLNLVGSFLPWERAGGFLGLVIYGIRVDFVNFKSWGVHVFPVHDYGGALVTLLTLAIVFLAVQRFSFIRNPILWKLIVSAVLVVSSLLFVGRWLIHWYEYRNMIEQPSLMMGLVCVLFGSAILFWEALMISRRNTYSQSENAG